MLSQLLSSSQKISYKKSRFSAFCQVKIFVVSHDFEIEIEIHTIKGFIDVIISITNHKKKSALIRPQFINSSMLPGQCLSD